MAEEPIDYDALTPTYLGRTWERGPDGKFVLPQHSLGWEIAGWCGAYLEDEDGNPWTFTNEQLRFLLWWYAVDELGRFVYRRGVLQRLKGWGKDPLLAVVCLVELCGPSRFSHWEDMPTGRIPRGKPVRSAWVQVAAVAKDQTANTVKCFSYMVTPQLREEYKIDMGIEYVRANGGRDMIELMTSNFRKAEGNRPTFILLNETHHWVSGNGGLKMYETLDGNTTKSKNGGARYLSITNAYLPGEDSVAERQRLAYEDVLAGRALDVGFYYDSVEAHPQTPLTPDALRVVVPKIAGDAWWLDIESIIASVANTSISPARSRRMWLNQIFADADGLHQPGDWDVLAEGWEGDKLDPGDEIVLGFDGGRTDDNTALVAIRIHDGFVWPLLIEGRPADWPHDRWEVDREKVDRAVDSAFDMYKVKAFYSDVALWESYTSAWSVKYGPQLEIRASTRNAVEWDMRNWRRVTFAHEFLMNLIRNVKIHHTGSWQGLHGLLRQHVLNARRADNSAGVSFRKESKESPKKVDAYAALVIAAQAWNDVLLRKKEEKVEKVRTGRGGFA